MENETVTLEKIGEGIETINNRLEGMDKRFDEIDKRFETVDGRFDAIDKRFEAVDKRFDAVDERFDEVDKRFKAVDGRFDRMEERIEKRFNKVAISLSSLEFDMLGVKSVLEIMNSKYDEAFGKLAGLLGRLADQETETALIRNEQNVMKAALKATIGLDVDSLEFR